MRMKQRFATGFFALALTIMMLAHGFASASPVEITDIDGNQYKTVT